MCLTAFHRRRLYMLYRCYYLLTYYIILMYVSILCLSTGIVPANNLWSARLRHQRHLLDKTPLAEPYISNEYTTNPVSVRICCILLLTSKSNKYIYIYIAYMLEAIVVRISFGKSYYNTTRDI